MTCPTQGPALAERALAVLVTVPQAQAPRKTGVAMAAAAVEQRLRVMSQGAAAGRQLGAHCQLSVTAAVVP